MTRKLLVAAAAIAIAACSRDGQTTNTSTPLATTTAAATTGQDSYGPISVAPPTGPATTTSHSTSTSATTTTVGSTTIAPEQVAESEVLVRLESFWEDVEACYAVPGDCDGKLIVDDYTNGGGKVVEWFNSWADGMKQKQQRLINQDASELTLRQVTAETNTRVLTSQCKIDRGSLIQDNSNGTEVVDDSTGYGRYDFTWENVDSRWIIVDSGIYNMVKPEDGGCAG